MKYFICVLCIFMNSILFSFSSEKQVEQRTAMVSEKNLDIDALLDEARVLGIAEETIEIKPISYPEYMFRKIGGSLLLTLLACKHSIQKRWNAYMHPAVDAA